jgi:hypothetical protein
MQANTLLTISSVVAGESHNPTILNPDFLIRNEIIDIGWGWEVKDTITTPPFSVVSYTNGVEITVQEGKLQVTQHCAQGQEVNFMLTASIARKYVKVLPHANYTATGNNFQSYVPIEKPDTYLIDNFLSNRPWMKGVTAAGIRLVFEIPDGMANFSFDGGSVTLNGDEPQEAILINCNNSRNCGNDMDVLAEYLNRLPRDISAFGQLVKAIFREEAKDATRGG